MAENKSEGTPEVDRPVRVDEAHKHLVAMIPLNAKRTYDEMQQELPSGHLIIGTMRLASIVLQPEPFRMR